MERFEFKQGTSSKFWEVKLDGKSFTTIFGKIGTAGQSATKKFDSAEKAQLEAKKLIAEKVKKGYAKVGSSAKSAKVVDTKSSPRATGAAKKGGASSFEALLAAIEKDAALGDKKREKVDSSAVETLKQACGVPSDLEALWRWGHIASFLSKDEITTASSFGWWVGQVWLNPSGALREWKFFEKAKKEIPEYPKNLLPIATDEAGNFSCIDCTTGELVDWDHETRRVRKWKTDLPKIMQKSHDVFVKQRANIERLKKQTESAATARALPSGKAPKKLVESPSAELRKVASECGGDLDIAGITGDGRFVVSKSSSSLYVVDLKNDKRLVPEEAGMIEDKKKNGYVMFDGQAIGLFANTLVATNAEKMQLWKFEGEKLRFLGAVSGKRYDHHVHSVAVCGDWYALRFTDSTAVYHVDDFPKAPSIAAAATKKMGKSRYSVKATTVQLVSNGDLLGIDDKEMLRRYGATGKSISKAVKVEYGAALTCIPDGSKVFVAEGKSVTVFDAKLEKLKALTFSAYGVTAQVTPDGSKLIVVLGNINGEVTSVHLIDTESLSTIASLPVKKLKAYGLRFIASDVSLLFEASRKAYYFG